ncbi:peptidylprolyl isomerase [Kribbella sandramycini]|uniref:Peptidyl-prolyl cis-trans isomerase n=1 Tax=Kribbella sandramycini TaxID=60450 RepID=A0A7Y4L461_9ACTN|nr:peptidylprolyl isomerase [Kribbella sandramycini]MBB6570934.1 peptidyl-prolyl cis-trans isomerase B (cyclophilin B) [Kribbella sandramycini]NOL44064.1 peptidylprolyl isomerase [Kribbella sandramycini]
MRGVIAGATLVVASLLVATPANAAPADAAAPPTGTKGPCGYTATPEEPPARPVSLPPDPKHTPNKGVVKVVVATNQGPMLLSLDRAKAPCTVQSFLHLAKSRFYDFTTCHRLTLYPTLKVLQCGDPSGTGSGGPGYSYKDELPTDLPNWPDDPTGTRKVYARGTLAMANAGPNTNGSQFFLVFGDSRLRPDYTVFGSLDRLGLKVLDKVAADGINPTAEDPAPVDGPPARKTDILVARSLGAW